MWQSNRASRQSIRHNHRHDRGETHKHTNHELKYSAKKNCRTPKRFAHTFRYTQIHSDTLRYTQIHSNTLKYTQIHSRIHSNTLKYTHEYTQIHSDTLKYTHRSCTNGSKELPRHFHALHATICKRFNTLLHLQHVATHVILCHRFRISAACYTYTFRILPFMPHFAADSTLYYTCNMLRRCRNL